MLNYLDKLKRIQIAQLDKRYQVNKIVVHPELVPLSQKHKVSIEQFTKYPEAKK
jgi:hypothetical protein